MSKITVGKYCFFSHSALRPEQTASKLPFKFELRIFILHFLWGFQESLFFQGKTKHLLNCKNNANIGTKNLTFDYISEETDPVTFVIEQYSR